MKEIQAIVLAAGEGTRMKSRLPKVLHRVMNKTMIERVIHTVKAIGVDKVAVIVGHRAEDVQHQLAKENVSFFLQEKQLGTGHAVMQAQEFIEADKDYIILYGDVPLLRQETLKDLIRFHQEENNGVSIISAVVEDSRGYGHIVRDTEGRFLKNVEYKDCSESEKLIKEVNSGIYCYKGSSLKQALTQITNHNAQEEYYLPDTLEVILKNGESVNAMTIEDVTEFFGVNSRQQLAQAESILKNRVNQGHMERGVTFIDPSQTYIEDSVVIGQDTIIYPGCILEGATVVSANCEIGPYSRLRNMKVGQNTIIQFSTALDSIVGEDTTVGPYAYIRPDSVIGDAVKIGDFVEVKNSVIGSGTKISHLTYVGDTDAGDNVNFGCGTVTVNYDGKKKFRTIIEDEVFIGCNANLVAPVTLKKGSYVAAGSTITKDIPEKSLGIARNRQENLEGWTKN